MKGIAISGLLLLLGGCASFASLEELEAQAMLTGDWSAVERRERIIARREAQDAVQCPSGAVGAHGDGSLRTLHSFLRLTPGDYAFPTFHRAPVSRQHRLRLQVLERRETRAPPQKQQ